ncbi:hypothetical protein FLBR109950_09465 [Flavobacterium branchiophilum]
MERFLYQCIEKNNIKWMLFIKLLYNFLYLFAF